MESNGHSGLGGPQNAQGMASNKRLQCVQAQVDEVVDIMRDNVEKVVQRDQNISELNKKAEFLDAEAQLFAHNAAEIKRKMWWKNAKMLIIMGAIGATLFIVLIVWIV